MQAFRAGLVVVMVAVAVVVLALAACTQGGAEATPEPTATPTVTAPAASPPATGNVGPPADSVQMEIVTLQREPQSQIWVVLLREQDGARFLPIVIGATESLAIAVEMEGIVPPRPLTPDLLHAAIMRLGGRLEHVAITELQGETFYAELTLVQNGQAITMDARPSDAIALALRADVPVYASRAVLDQAGFADEDPGILASTRL